MSFYRRWKSVRKYPVAYASLALVAWLIVFATALDFYFVRTNVFETSKNYLPDWLNSTPHVLLAVSVIYLGNVALVSINGYWRKLLDDFDNLTRRHRMMGNVLTATIFGGTLIWFLIEVMLV
jgi:hypothetical protein